MRNIPEKLQRTPGDGLLKQFTAEKGITLLQNCQELQVHVGNHLTYTPLKTTEGQ